ncbi:MAG: phosphate uptake regulator PhoU [Candidatus Thermoplasmatota archaeon]|jgi:phosphate uptake regulator|nr:phosphate uptake regulator PhoU [Candidatus Thermoplasmatota archaeon]MCL5954709.1 phosphate uptake regulator PhoU [Candidatus Thermoplasmatota archaeon]
MAAYTRRIQLTGGSTYIISLPSKWIKENRLEKGSELSIDETNGNLLISQAAQGKSELVKRINIEGKVDLDNFQRALTSLYIADFDTLIIRSSQYIDDNLREMVKKFSRLVMGVEIFEESSRTIVLQNVLDTNSFPMANAVRRMSLNVETMLGDVIKGIEDNDTKLLESVISRDDDVDRYQLYVYRMVNRRKNEAENSIYFLIFSRILERIADHAVNICRIWASGEHVQEDGKTAIVEFMKRATSLYNSSVEAFYAKKFEALNSIISRKPAFIEEKQTMMDSAADSSYSHYTSPISEEALRVALYATDIAELAMDLILGNKMDFVIYS